MPRPSRGFRGEGLPPADDGVVDHEHHDCADDRYEKTIEIESGDSGVAERVEEPAADDGSDDSENDIEQDSLS